MQLCIAIKRAQRVNDSSTKGASGTHQRQAVDLLLADRIPQLDLVVERVPLVVAHQLHQALKLHCSYRVKSSLHFDPAVFDFLLRSAR